MFCISSHCCAHAGLQALNLHDAFCSADGHLNALQISVPGLNGICSVFFVCSKCALLNPEFVADFESTL